MFRSAVDLSFYAHLPHFGADLLHYAVEECLSLLPFLVDALRDVLVLIGEEVHHGEILKLAFEEGDAQSPREGRVDVQRLSRHSLLFLGGDISQRTHVVQPVRELYDDDAKVLRHSHEELAEVLRLRVLTVVELQFVELGDALHEFEDLLSELGGKLLRSDRRVLQDVVQERSYERGTVKAVVREDLHDGTGMDEIVLPRAAFLSRMRLFGEFVSPFEIRILFRIGLTQFDQQFVHASCLAFT